jgi:hypothetical protein
LLVSILIVGNQYQKLLPKTTTEIGKCYQKFATKKCSKIYVTKKCYQK